MQSGWFIAEENRDAAERVELEIVATCGRLAKHPRIGTKRQDITALPVRFWTVTKFPNYVIVYRPETAPLQVVAALHGKRDLKQVLEWLEAGARPPTCAHRFDV